MAITVNWPTKVINVPKVDTLLIQASPTEIRQLDLNAFRLTIADLQDNFDAMPYDTAIEHTGPVTVGGVQLARVVELINDYTVTFEDGQYAVNLVGANSNLADRVNVNQVSIRASNSAGLVTSSGIEAIEYNQRVYIDTGSSVTGTVYPAGTQRAPVNNVTDAQTIATARGFSILHFASNYTFGATDVLDRYIIEGEGASLTHLMTVAGTSTDETEFRSCELMGPMNGAVNIVDCHILVITNFGADAHESSIIRCLLEPGTVITMRAGALANIHIIDTVSGSPGNTPVDIDWNGTGPNATIRKYAGGVRLLNVTNGAEISVDGDGHLTVDSTSTDVNLAVRGDIKVTDNRVVKTPAIAEQGTFERLEQLHNAHELDVDPTFLVKDRVWTKALSELTDATTVGGYLARKVLTALRFLSLR